MSLSITQSQALAQRGRENAAGLFFSKNITITLTKTKLLLSGEVVQIKVSWHVKKFNCYYYFNIVFYCTFIISLSKILFL